MWPDEAPTGTDCQAVIGWHMPPSGRHREKGGEGVEGRALLLLRRNATCVTERGRVGMGKGVGVGEITLMTLEDNPPGAGDTLQTEEGEKNRSPTRGWSSPDAPH